MDGQITQTEEEEVRQSDEYIQRLNRLEDLRSMGVEPFGEAFDRTHRIEDLVKAYDEAVGAGDDAVEELPTFRIAGRIMSMRGMGKASFCNLTDVTGTLQFYVRQDSISEIEFTAFRKLYVGDLIGVEGRLFMTKKNELTLRVSKIDILSCGIRPLPEKHKGLRDKETRYRRRYVDLIVNPEVRQTFITRSKLITSIRRTLDEKDYIEVETPILSSIAGGAAARPFKTFHNTLKMDFFLRIATELHLKRLLVGGLEKVYEIGRIFRNEGVSQKHNPEFTTIELYEAYSDFEGMMNLCEELISNACNSVHGSPKVNYDEKTVDFTGPWRRMRYLESIAEFGGYSMDQLQTVESVRELCRDRKIEVDLKLPLGKLYDALFEEVVEPHLFQPTFIYDYPKELSPLAKQIPDQPNMTYRFEAFVANMEIANAFSELNDPVDQYERFKQQMKDREQGDDEAHEMDVDYVEALEYGMPPAGGMGIGIDRLAMILSGNTSIREVILFPHLRNK